ncbi:MAG: 4'-phosphopantetheinyl transferase superfamily protein [Nannocystaceae bacterium]
MPAIELGVGEVHVWEVEPEAIAVQERLDRYAGWLSAAEVARRQRFKFERHRHAFLIARALVRGTLTRYVPAIAPAGWRFLIGAHGRPEIDPSLGAGDLRFNLSHTHGRAVLAVARGDDVGVDVEARDRKGNLRGISSHFFAAPEVASLAGLEGPALAERFFDYWTLKEAYMKARGVGISLGLGRFWFTIGEGGAIAINFTDGFDDEPADWSFCRFDLGSTHPVAVALRRPRGSPLRVVLQRALPDEARVRSERVEGGASTGLVVADAAEP